MRLLIKNAVIMDPASGRSIRGDIAIKDGIIETISEKSLTADAEAEIIDASGLTAAPGLVDTHVHFRDPGYTYKEDIISGARAAAAGGFTSVVCMANTNPAVDSPETVSYILEKARQADIRVYTAATITKGLKGQELTDFVQLLKAGAVGFTDDGIPIMDEALLEKAMLQAAELDVPISLHEEDPALIERQGVNKGKVSDALNYGGAPAVSEYSMVQRDCQLAWKTRAITVIQHISAAQSVEAVRQAWKKGAKVHAEATPQHFSLTEEIVLEKGSLARVNPPIRTEADRQAIIEGLKDGTLDIIATDHAPHSREEKNRDIKNAPSGMIGLETSLALGITNLVKPGYLTLMELLEKMTVNPARLYHLNAGILAEGGPADIVLFDEKESWTVEDSFRSKSNNSPFIGMTLTGKVKYTICGGNVVFGEKRK